MQCNLRQMSCYANLSFVIHSFVPMCLGGGGCTLPVIRRFVFPLFTYRITIN